MKKYFMSLVIALALCLLPMTVFAAGEAPAAGVEINEENFPDANFRDFVKYYLPGGEGMDGILTEAELAGIKALNLINNYNVYNLDGIEFFTSLEELNIMGCGISTVDFSGNPKLKYLKCGSGPLKELYLKKNKELGTLICFDAFDLYELDLSGNPNLEKLQVVDTGLLSLDLSQNTILTSLSCEANSRTILDGTPVSEIKGLDLSKLENPQGGNFDGGRVNFTADKLTYQYDLNTTIKGYPPQTFILHRKQEGADHVYPGRVIWTEGFEGEGMPEGWTVNNANGDYYQWETKRVRTNYSEFHSHHGFGLATVKAMSGSDDWLYTPEFTVEDGDRISYSFLEDSSDNNRSRLGVYVVREGQEPVRLGDERITWLDWQNITENLSAYAGQNVRVAFVCQGSEGLGRISLDCVTLWNDRVAINEKNFPDPAFRNFVRSVAQKDYFLYTELPTITSLNCQGREIRDLTGIAYFTELRELICRYNQLTALDVSKLAKLEGLYCDRNRLTELDLSHNPELTDLNFSENCMTHVNLQNNPKLTAPWGNGNVAEVEHLAKLPDTFDPSLVEEVNGGHFNGRQVVYDTDAVAMTYTYRCKPGASIQFKVKLPPIPVDKAHFPDDGFRQKVEHYYAPDGMLDRERANRETSLTCSGSGIADLTGIEYFPNLEKLDCSGNQLTELDLSKTPKLTQLLCHQNQLTELDLSKTPELTQLLCYLNPLTKLDLSKTPKLTELDCSYTRLTELDVTGCPELVRLTCTDMPLRELDLSCNNKLEFINCGGDRLRELKLLKHPHLTTLYGNNNWLTDLVVTGCPELQGLYVSGNQLRALDLRYNTKLSDLDYQYNQLVCLDTSRSPALSESYYTAVWGGGNRRSVRENTALTALDPSFDISKASWFSGGSFEGGRVHFNEGSEEITYNYALDERLSQPFTLVKQSETYMELSNDGKTLLVGCGQDATLVLATYDPFGQMQSVQCRTIPGGTLNRAVPFAPGQMAFLLDENHAPLCPAVGAP